MDSIKDMIEGKITEAVLGKMGEQFGIDASKAGGLVKIALPMILGGLGKNVQSQNGAQALDSALTKDHDGSILDHIQEAVTDQSKQDEGQKILGHIFGDKLGNITNMLGKTAETEPEKAGGILGSLAPIVLGQLGRSKKEQGLNIEDLTSMLGSEKKQADSNLGGMMALLDRDNDGSIMDDVLEIGKKFF